MGPPKPPVPHVAPIYRVTATALGAGMWFWLMYRAKKDGKTPNSHTNFSMIDSNDLISHRPRFAWLEAPLGPLDNSIRSGFEIKNGMLLYHWDIGYSL
ncbi:hypothetical protein T069G_09759 [Trichoderma breve]|uniref:Uncharacterized protein n=1 Tax=Trichoderma breve TaxID=2034170 RepID=A0A9W9BB88_9HYPO|nr:hypothetical protein T069G_09759 [Trichoderma breve]KAJ4856391.1 hypothetical protein T069G_09759 [Trichoderma breve]